jgi:hypothetical protein
LQRPRQTGLAGPAPRFKAVIRFDAPRWGYAIEGIAAGRRRLKNAQAINFHDSSIACGQVRPGKHQGNLQCVKCCPSVHLP